MSAPYHIREFTAASGNSCRLKIYPIQPSGNQPVDCTWEDPPSHEDMTECDRWYAANVAPGCAREAGRTQGPLASTHIEDPELREAAIKQMTEGAKGRIVGMRTSDIIGRIPGSRSNFTCSSCGHQITLAPSGSDFVNANPGIVVTCTKCFDGVKPNEVEALAPGAIQEIDSYQRRN